ncbi:MAG: RDD family protein [Aureispira sp.]|nr:RDD family protein [Aureispira sp.]
MNTEILDDKDFKGEELKKTYPTLGARFIASILDVLIITVPIGLLSLANIVYLQSTLIACLLMLVFPFYKVYMEGTYGYTIGKKLQGFKIIKEGTENEEMDMKTSMLRYIFGFLVLLFSFIATFYTFQIITEGGWESFENFAEKSAAAQLTVPAFLSAITNLINLVYFVAILFIFQGGKRQTLYDRIAKTVCVVNTDND